MDKKMKPCRGDAFDLPGDSVVAAAVQPRKQTANLRRTPINIVIENAAIGRQNWERRRAMAMARI